MQTDDELLQDFLIEAGELIDGMDGQLVGLENSPDDQGMLNGIFRTFHTIKGGAGFLGLKPLVSICHHAEEALNLVRAGRCRLDASNVDLILRSVDEVKRMFAEVGAGRSPEPASDELLRSLDALTQVSAKPDRSDGAPDASTADSAAAAHERDERNQSNEFTESDEQVEHYDPVLASFEAMLDHAGLAESSTALEGATNEMPEEDFDALIDAIQGRGVAGSDPTPIQTSVAMPVQPPVAMPVPTLVPTPVPMPSDAPDEQKRSSPAAAGEAVDAASPQAHDRRVGDRRSPSASASTEGSANTLRVDAARVDGVMNLVGELVLVRNRLSALRTRVRDDDLNRTLSRLNLVTSDLQGSVMRLRMQPLSKAFGRFPRVVRDLARQLGKEVVLEMSGETTELDKGMVESLADPLVHLVRNAVDHGIELPSERESAGKPACGCLTLAAHQEGSHIFITVSDDGGGLDPAVIKQKALDKGLIDARTALQLSDADALQLVFTAGFSTRTEVSDISGRGVGLDVVKNQIARVNGNVDIHSEKGRGTRIVIRLPLTLAILPALMVVVANQRLAFPLPIVEEIVDLEPQDCSTMDGSEVLSLRNEVLPLLDLERWVGREAASTDSDSHGEGMFAIIANAGARRVALVVHQLIGQEEVVIKSLGGRLQGLPGFAGATITGDGGIALIVDVGTLYASWTQLAVHGTARSIA